MLELTEEQQERIDIIRHKLKYVEQKPTVACIETMEPLTMAGYGVPDQVSLAGGDPLVYASGWDAIAQHDPDIIILMPRGSSVEEGLKKMNYLLQLPDFDELKAVKTNRLYIADGSRFFYVDNIIDSVELLAEIINPKQFIFGFEGNGWIRFSV